MQYWNLLKPHNLYSNDGNGKARSVLTVSIKKTDSLNCWLQNLCDRRNKNIAAVALENKNARIIWAILTKKTDYQMDCVAA